MAFDESMCRLCSHSPAQVDVLEDTSLRKFVHSLNLTVPDLLKSNDPPCETRSKEIQAALIGESTKLAKIDSQMAQLQKTLADLFTERTQTQRKILDYKAILHPIRRVPGDVLGEVFNWLINENVSEDEETCSYDPKGMIWSLPHVSRQWRSAALSFPRLWSTVRVNISSPKPSRKNVAPAHAVFMLGVQLQRSDRRPLSVSIYSTDSKFSSTNPILQALFPTSHRWRNLHLSLSIRSFDALRPLTTSFPLLRCLHLYLSPGDVDRIPQSPLSTMFQFCPNLQELHGHPRYYSVMKIPFSQIRTLDGSLSYVHSDDCLKLTRLPNLYRLVLSPEDRDEPCVNHPEVTLSCLSSLVLTTDEGDPIHLLRYLKAPSLDRLSVIGLDRVCDLVSFLRRSNSQALTSLTFKSTVLKDTDCIQVLEAVPFLTSLTLSCPLAYTNKFIDRLTGGNSRPRLVPSLSVFKVTGAVALGDDQATKLKTARPELLLS